MERAQSVNIKTVSLEGFTPVRRVQDRYNLSIPNVIFSNLRVPTVPQNQSVSAIILALGARGPRFESGRPDQDITFVFNVLVFSS
jgi:hypothetical protein